MRHMMILTVLLTGCDSSIGDGSADDAGMPGLYDQGLPGLYDEDGGSGGDADGDGYSTSEEQQAGTNPNYAPSHPYTGGYNVGFCESEPVPTGPTGNNGYNDSYVAGDVVENFTLTDQYGEEVELYSFCGQNVMLAIGAFW